VWVHRRIELRARERGIHLVGEEIEAALPELADLGVGLLHLHLQHTSAALAVNENASADVRADLAEWFDRAVPDGAAYFRHVLEGPDDMPAHVKAVLAGASLTLPIADGALALGTWQGIYVCEFRDRGGARRVVATLQGEPR
jgi:secondary thiamine-phosphate synthase enzyme